MSWWRNYVRSKTRPIPHERALRVKRHLSMAYLFCAWNAFAFGVYFYVRDSYPKTEEEKSNPSKYYARLMATPDSTVLRYSGLTLVDKFQIEGRDVGEQNRIKKWFMTEDEKKEDRESKEIEEKEHQDLNLLVEETNSL